MANLTPTPEENADVMQWDGVTPLAGGGPTAPLNRQAQALLNQIAWVKEQIIGLATAISTAVNDRLRYSLTASLVTTSGLSSDFTGIPSWAKEITISLKGVSFNGSAVPIIQAGTGSIVTSGYDTSCSSITGAIGFSTATAASGITLNSVSGADAISGSITLTKVSGNTWSVKMSGKMAATTSFFGGGNFVLGADLDRLRLTSTVGTATLDGGEWSLFIKG